MVEFPKIIHYCWFGKAEMPQEIKAYIESWKRVLPDWEYMCWSEENFDIQNSIPYVQEAYRQKKYAFVSDYVRLYALYTHGGVYLDTDIEIRQSFEELLESEQEEIVTGFEMKDKLITAFIAAKPQNAIVSEFLAGYKERHFVLPNKELDLTTINDRFTQLMEKYGLVKNNQEQVLQGTVHIYPYEYFAGQDIENSHEKITDKTYTIHHFQGSWVKTKWTTWIKYRVIVKTAQKIVGYDNYDKLKAKLGL